MTPDINAAPSSLHEIADSAVELAELRQAADDILRQAWGVRRTRSLLDGPEPAYDHGLWETVTRLGWPAVLVSEANGGGGAGLRELCVLAEATGAVAAPVPLANVSAACWCEDGGVGGTTLLLGDVGARVEGAGVSGAWTLVPHGSVATRLLVIADRAGEPILGAVDPAGTGVRRQAVRPLDHGPAACITLDDAPIEVIQTGPGARRRHQDAWHRFQLATIAEVIGTAAAANQAAIDYAKVRVAFGRPIGTYQAVKHRLVDQRSTIEVARALVNRAADACEQEEADATALVSLAAFWAIDSLRRVPEGATQVFGGIAYTWEHDAHVYLRRVATQLATLGSRPHHRAIVAEWLAARSDAQR